MHTLAVGEFIGHLMLAIFGTAVAIPVFYVLIKNFPAICWAVVAFIWSSGRN